MTALNMRDNFTLLISAMFVSSWRHVKCGFVAKNLSFIFIRLQSFPQISRSYYLFFTFLYLRQGYVLHKNGV